MSQIQLPDALIQQIQAAGVSGGAIAEFVQQAVREKLADQKCCARDDQAVADFDTLCDEADISAPGPRLTRDQLHERD
jgi:uncharacterized protein YoaH (UPF0181 family)